MAKCLVLGANGFLGSHLVDSLLAAGNKVRAFDRFSGKTMFKDTQDVEMYYGDFLNKNDLVGALQGIEYVFHFISTTTPATAENNPLIDIETNIRMSVELLQVCISSNIKRVIFASTGGAIYGEGGNKAFSEEDNPKPVSPYAIGKLTIEHYLRYFRVKHGLDSIVLRISNPYGERQPLHRKQGVIPIFLEKVNGDQPITVLGDGTMVRDYIYVQDVADMVTTMFDKATKHEIYNIGSGMGVTVNDLVKGVETACGKTAKINRQPAPPTFVHKVVLDTRRFINEFNISPTTPLADGLVKTLEYIKHKASEGDAQKS